MEKDDHIRLLQSTFLQNPTDTILIQGPAVKRYEEESKNTSGNNINVQGTGNVEWLLFFGNIAVL